MPKVTSFPAAATSAARRTASLKASVPRIAWSEASTSSTGSSFSQASAAIATAAAVLRPAGSSTMRAAMPISASWSCTRKRCASLQITMGCTGPAASRARSAVSCSSVRPVTSGRNCLGSSWRDTGQSRLPAPPHRMTGTMLFGMGYFRSESAWIIPRARATSAACVNCSRCSRAAMRGSGRGRPARIASRICAKCRPPSWRGSR